MINKSNKLAKFDIFIPKIERQIYKIDNFLPKKAFFVQQFVRFYNYVYLITLGQNQM